MEIWSIEKPFDNFLLKYWPTESVDRLIAVLTANTNHDEIVDWLTPNVEKSALFAENSLIKTIRSFYKQKNVCDRHKFCQNVNLHSTGLRCVTAAAIRRRLRAHLRDFVLFDDGPFLTRAIGHHCPNKTRRNIGVLVLNCGTAHSPCRQRILKVLFDNFYLYTTPVVDVASADGGEQINSTTVGFIAKQIYCNADCMVILVDEPLIRSWKRSSETVCNVLGRSIRCDFRIRLVIISVCAAADPVTNALGRRHGHLKPALLMFDQFEIAPCGGLISFIEQSCKLSIGNTCLKYWLRGLQVLDMFHSR